MDARETSLRFYQNNRCTTEICGSVTRSYFHHEGNLLAQRTAGADTPLLLFAVNSSNTVMSAFEQAGRTQYRYTPYGQRPASADSNMPLGFNGEQLDEVTDCYSLGNGYRQYSPVLQRLCSPDDESPFEEGGLNAYAYCVGDPVNNVDPTGHFSFSLLITATTGLASIGTLIASFIVKDPKARSALQAVSGILGTVALVAGTYYQGKRISLGPSRGAPVVRGNTAQPPGTPQNNNYRSAARSLNSGPPEDNNEGFEPIGLYMAPQTYFIPRARIQPGVRADTPANRHPAPGAPTTGLPAGAKTIRNLKN
ncbi:RHS repeat-associated core domain-containing protein [Pseudomonas sp. S1(2024)]|uniref:RHS repeat-associated core domain-containing protein n=1 Tax=Pseudomonas sp. S1(2024) TaxID=3390191 RepID=UPI0039789B20